MGSRRPRRSSAADRGGGHRRCEVSLRHGLDDALRERKLDRDEDERCEARIGDWTEESVVGAAELVDPVARLPIRRGATPLEAALGYVDAMENGYITGQRFPIDGGALLVSPQQ